MDGSRPGQAASAGSSPDPANTPAGPTAPDATPWSRFDAWSQNSFAILALLGVLGYLLLVGAASGAGPPILGLLTASVVLAVGPLVAVILGIRRGASWARPAAVAVLWAVILAGVIQVVTDLLVPRLTIPLGAILAVVVLSTHPPVRPSAAARDRRIALALGAVYLATGVLGGLSTVISSPPAFMVADEGDLAIGISTNCADAGFVPGETDVLATVTWRWNRRDALPLVDDAFQVEWSPFTGLTRRGERGVIAGDIEIDPDGSAATQLDQPGIGGSSNHARYGLAGVSKAAADGSMDVVLAWEGGREPQFADIVLTWAHGSRWTSLAYAICEWPVQASPEPSTAP